MSRRAVRSRVFAVAVAAAIVGAPATVHADDAPTTTPPDIVRFKNGGILRGTILESVPNDRVDIRAPDGQTRRIPWAEVEYAGPATSVPPPPATAPGVPIQFDGDVGDELRIYMRAADVRVAGVAGGHVIV